MIPFRRPSPRPRRKDQPSDPPPASPSSLLPLRREDRTDRTGQDRRRRAPRAQENQVEVAPPSHHIPSRPARAQPAPTPPTSTTTTTTTGAGRHKWLPPPGPRRNVNIKMLEIVRRQRTRPAPDAAGCCWMLLTRERTRQCSARDRIDRLARWLGTGRPPVIGPAARGGRDRG
jgi:hypothetical protein